jgi:hypothetical protein
MRKCLSEPFAIDFERQNMKNVPLPIDCNGLNEVDKTRIAEIGLWVWMDEQIALSPIAVCTSAHRESGRVSVEFEAFNT